MKQTSSARIEPAIAADLPGILEIVNRETRQGFALWSEREKTLDELTDWFEERRGGGFPILAARVEGALAGYATFGPFRPHDGYRETVEHSLYVAPGCQGRGIGRALLIALEQAARAAEVRVMVGGIEAGNAASIALHRSCGFVETARMPEVGLKFDRRLTLVLMQKILERQGGLDKGALGASSS